MERGGRGREGMDDCYARANRPAAVVIHIILMAPKYSYNNDVTYYVITPNNDT